MIHILWQVPVVFCAAFLISFAANALALGPWRRAGSVHWTERARLLSPARTSAGSNLLCVPVILYLGLKLGLPKSVAWWLPIIFSGILGSVFGCVPMNCELFPGFKSGMFRHLSLYLLLRSSVWLMFLIAVSLMPADFSWLTWVIALAYLAFHLLLVCGWNLKFLRWGGLLEPASPRLHQIVQETAGRMQVRVKNVWLLKGPMALAFALPTTGELLFSEQLLNICDDAEIAAICAHELAHLTESRTILAGRILGTLVYFPWLFIAPLTEAWGLFGFILLAALMFATAQFSQRLSLKMEKRADKLAAGAELQEGVYARALEKLYRENHLPAVNATTRQTHPHLYDRLLAAGITPDYPRPAAPAKHSWTGAVIYTTFGILVAVYVVTYLNKLAPN